MIIQKYYISVALLLLHIVVLTFFAYDLFSDENDKEFNEKYNSIIGVYGHYNINLHSASFNKLPNIPNCCPNFESGIGSGVSLGLLYEYPLAKSFSLSLRAGYATYDALLQKVESTTVLLDGEPTTGEFEHSLNAYIDNLDFEPTIRWNIFDKFSISAGINVGYSISKSYDQYEKIIKPEGRVTFKDPEGNDSHSIFRNKSDGKIPDANAISMSVVAGLSYELPLNHKKTFFIVPEAQYYVGLTAVVKDYDWSVNSLKAGLALKYYIRPEQEVIEKFEFQKEIDTITVKLYEITESKIIEGLQNVRIDTLEKDYLRKITEIYSRTDTLFMPIDYELKASIKAVAVNENGEEIEFPTFQVEEFLSTKMHPILNYVFFDQNSPEIPERYIQLDKNKATIFNTDKLFNYSTIEVYYYVLNIIADRLTKYPEAQLTLTGCNNDINEEKNNMELSSKRAENIKKYLVDIWNINDNRIKIQIRNLPLQKSNNSIPEGQAENRRVEIISNDLRIMSPLIINDTLRKTSLINEKSEIVSDIRVDGINLKPKISPETALKQWNINVRNKEATLKDISSTEKLPGLINWKFENERQRMEVFKDTTFINFSIEARNGKKAEDQFVLGSKSKTIKTKKENKEGDKKIDNYALILFEFGSMNLSKWNKDIPSLINKNFEPNSLIKVTGYSDRVGDTNINLQLSTQRAKVVAEALNHENVSYEGVGESILLYNNDLPEGRFYCRTVDIEVVTAIQW